MTSEIKFGFNNYYVKYKKNNQKLATYNGNLKQLMITIKFPKYYSENLDEKYFTYTETFENPPSHFVVAESLRKAKVEFDKEIKDKRIDYYSQIINKILAK